MLLLLERAAPVNFAFLEGNSRFKPISQLAHWPSCSRPGTQHLHCLLADRSGITAVAHEIVAFGEGMRKA